jgi:predicted O-methyltransferase YrrM
VRVTSDALANVPGWFDALDQALFSWFLSEQTAGGQTGDLAEIGVFKGKSAILIGDHLKQGEVFTVIDLFEDPSENPQAEAAQKAYAGLTQRVFEANYLRFHSHLPTVIRGESRTILDHARAGIHRFVHIDGSHLYEDVRVDLESARRLLGESGVVAIDDFRSVHTPGVAAAVWEAIVTGRLHAFVVSESKLYATCADSDEWLRKLIRWLPRSGLGWDQQEVFGRPLLRVWPITPVGRRLAEALAPPAILRRFDEALELRRAGMSLGEIARFEARDVAAAARRRLR